MRSEPLSRTAALELATAQVDAKLSEMNSRGYPVYQLTLAQRNDEVIKLARFLSEESE